MNRYLPLVFIGGAVAGFAGGYFYTKKKYEALIEQEVASVKESLSKMKVTVKIDKPEEQKEVATKATHKPDILAYGKNLKEEGYVNYADISEGKRPSEPNPLGREKPYAISPDEFGEMYDYEKISLTYYADDVLTDDADEPIDDVEETIGVDNLSKMGEYEEDALYIRNDQRKCDFEVLADHRNYYDVMNWKECMDDEEEE